MPFRVVQIQAPRERTEDQAERLICAARRPQLDKSSAKHQRPQLDPHPPPRPRITGKVQNVKLVASRVYPASIVPAGIGAGRVLSKLQLGILLCSTEFYRNIVDEFSYAHDEYVNKFSPVLHHVPTATPERHATGLIVNHNLAESYMVEAWFRTQGRPATVVLMQNNSQRIAAGFSLYVILYAVETYLAMQNAANGTAYVFLTMQGISVCAWLSGVMILQVKRGQGKERVALKVVVEGNKVPSREFVAAIDRTLSGVRTSMTAEWYRFGTKDILEELARTKRNLKWRRWL